MNRLYTNPELLQASLAHIDPNNVGIVHGTGALALQAKRPIDGPSIPFSDLDILASPSDVYQLYYYANDVGIFNVLPDESGTKLKGFSATPKRGQTGMYIKAQVTSGVSDEFSQFSYERWNNPEYYEEVHVHTAYEGDVVVRVVKGEVALRYKIQARREKDLAGMANLLKASFNGGIITYDQHQELSTFLTAAQQRTITEPSGVRRVRSFRSDD